MEEKIVLLPIGSIKPNPWNPNLMFEAERQRLRECMAASGPEMTPPIFVRRVGDFYEIIDGEQRWLAAKELGWTHIPAVVRDVPDAEAKKLTLSFNYLKGRMNYIKIARWIRDRKDDEMLTAFKAIFGVRLTEVLMGLVNLPDEYLNMIEEIIQQGRELTLSKLEPVVKARDPREVLTEMLISEKFVMDLAFYTATHGLEAAIKRVEGQEKMDEDWRVKKIEAVEKIEEEKRRRMEEEEMRRREKEEMRRKAIEERMKKIEEKEEKMERIEEKEEKKEGIGEKEEKEEAEIEEGGESLEESERERYILPPEHARRLLGLSPEEALKSARKIEPLAEAAIYYECSCCKSIHALVYKRGELEAYIVKRGSGEISAEGYERMLKETSARVYACPRCNLKFTLDYESGVAQPLPEETEHEEAGQNQQ